MLNSKIVDNKLYLPDIQLARNDYLKLSKELTSLGGKWKGGKVGAFVFDFDPTLISPFVYRKKIKNYFNFLERAKLEMKKRNLLNTLHGLDSDLYL